MVRIHARREVIQDRIELVLAMQEAMSANLFRYLRAKKLENMSTKENELQAMRERSRLLRRLAFGKDHFHQCMKSIRILGTLDYERWERECYRV